jgi:hypothetical protein
VFLFALLSAEKNISLHLISYANKIQLRKEKSNTGIALSFYFKTRDTHYDDINQLSKLFDRCNLNPHVEFVDDMDSMLMNFEIE